MLFSTILHIVVLVKQGDTMKSIKDNSDEYYALVSKRSYCSRNSVKYNAYTELIRVNKMERKLIIEEDAINRQNEKLQERIRRLDRQKRLKEEMLDIAKTKIEKYLEDIDYEDHNPVHKVLDT